MSDTSIPQRTCTNKECGKTYPATLEYFHYQKNGKYGLSSWCIFCHRERNNRNKRIRMQDAEYRERQRINSEEYRRNNPDKIKQHNKDYYWNNLERERARIKNNNKRFLPRILRYNAEYRAKHREVILRQNNDRRARKMATDPDYRIRTLASKKKIKATRRARVLNATGSHTAADILLQRKAQTDKKGRLRCWWCGGIITNDDYHLDHRQPLARGGSNGADNIVISCPTCNLSKNAKTPLEFAGRML